MDCLYLTLLDVQGMSPKNQKRVPSFFDKEGRPTKVRIYYQTETIDCWTIVFTGHYRKQPRDSFLYLSASNDPFHPQGVGMHGESRVPIDRPSYAQLGKVKKYDSLPGAVQRFVLKDYLALWGFTNEDAKGI